MKKIVLFAAVLLIFSGSVAMAKGYKAITGDAELNVMLGDLNLYARGDTENFITDLGVSYGVSTSDLRYHLEAGMHAGDLYMAARLSNMTDHSFDYVTKLYNRNRGEGWGVIAKSLGIKPGSAEFHALKDSGMIKKAKGHKHKGHGTHKGGKGGKGKGKK